MKKLVALALCVISFGALGQQIAPVNTSVAALLADQVPWWWYQAPPSSRVVPLAENETLPPFLVERARALPVNYTARAVVFVDGKTIVHEEFGAPATKSSTYNSFSIGKTVTSMAVGKAICAGKLSLATKSEEVLPELAGTALGQATVRELLMMASGAADSDPSGEIMTKEEAAAWQRGDLDLVDIIKTPRVSSAQKGVFSVYKPGEKFSYKNTDPDVLALMVQRATDMTFGEWIKQNIFDEMGLAHVAKLVQDKYDHAIGHGGIRLKLDDWVRFAVWVKRSSQEQGCFGNYVREASSTQINNWGTPQTRRTGKVFGGYGYLIWTENMFAPNTFWARGAGGQLIGWSPRTDRIFIMFATSEDWLPEAYKLANDWLN